MANSLKISPEIVEKYKEYLATLNAQKTQKRKLSSLRRFFTFLNQEGKIKENPMESAPVASRKAWQPEPGTRKRVPFGRLFLIGGGAALALILAFLMYSRFPIPLPLLGIALTPPTPIQSEPTPTPSQLPKAQIIPPTEQLPTPTPEEAPSESLTAKILELLGTEPLIRALGGPLLITSPGITLQTTPLSDGNITFAPDGAGQLLIRSSTTSQDSIDIRNANLTTGSLISGAVTNNGTEYNLISLSSGSGGTKTQFSVDALGNTFIGGTLNLNSNLATGGNLLTGGVTRLTATGSATNITGYTQASGNFTITQNASDFAKITKNASATVDLLTLSLAEKRVPNSKYDTLVLERINGANDAYALHVKEGNVLLAEALTVDGSLTVRGTTLASSGNIETTGNLTVDGNTTLGNASTDTVTLKASTLTTNNGLTLAGDGTGTDTLTIQSYTNLTFNLTDNTTNALDIQQGSDNYININTTNSSENISFGNTTINPSFSFLGTGTATFSGQGTFTRAPASAHTGTWAINSSTWNVSDSTLYINPSSSVADGNLLGLAVAGNVKFAVDAEGDIFGNNMTLAGTVTQGTTTIVGSLTVEGNTTLGDASTDTLTINPATITATNTTAFNCTDCIDFDDLEDTLDIDATTTINTTATTTTPLSYLADSLTSGIAFLFSFDALTTGQGLDLSSTSASWTSADLIQADQTATYTATTTVSGNILDLSRSLTASGAITLTVSGAVATISDNCAVSGGGTCTNTANILLLTQSFASSTGNVLSISNAGTGNAIEIGGAGTRSINSTSGNLTIRTTTSGNIILDSAGNIVDIDDATISLATQATDIDIIDNTASALTISEGTNNYLVISTTDTTTSLSLDLPVAGSTSTTGNLFTSSVAKTINIGTGTSADTINIGTGGTSADTITFGNTGVATTFVFNSGVTTQTALSLATASLTTGEALDITTTSTPTAGGTQSVVDLNFTNSPSTSANTLRGVDLAFTDTGTLANTVYGLYVDATTANANDTTYPAVLLGGNVGVGTSTPSTRLHAAIDDATNTNITNVLTLDHTTTGTARGPGFNPDTNATLNTSLIAYWKMDETSAGTSAVTRNDSFGSNNLTDTNTVPSGTGKINNAADPERDNNEQFLINDNADLSINSSNFTISAWVQLESKPVGGIMGIMARVDNPATTREYDLVYRTSTDRFEFTVWNGTTGSTLVTASTFGSPALATWYYITAYYNNTNDEIGISVNNGTVNTATTTITVPDTAAKTAVGNRQFDIASDAPWDGLIDEVGFWKKQLSAQEITDLYNSGSGNSYSTTGIGTGLLFRSEDSVGTTENAARIFGTFSTVTNGSEASSLVFETRTAGAALARNMRLGNTGNLIIAGTLTQSGSPDIAENILVTDTSIEAGDIVVVDKDYKPPGESSIYDRTAAKKSASPYEKGILGVISSGPGIILNAPKESVYNDQRSQPDERPLVLAGRVPVKVSDENGPILVGDRIASSSIPGMGMKATKPGHVVGIALEPFDESMSNVKCQMSNGQEVSCGKILTFVNVSWYDPDVYLTSTGELQLKNFQFPISNFQSPNQSSQSSDATGQANSNDSIVNENSIIENSLKINNWQLKIGEEVISRIGAFGEAVIAQLKAGLIETNELISSTVRVEKKLVSPLVESDKLAVGEIKSATSSGDIVIDLSRKVASDSAQAIPSGFGKLLVRGNVEIEGQATISGELRAKSIEAQEATISGTIYADQIIARKATFGDLLAATVSATYLVRSDIETVEERLAKLESSVIDDQSSVNDQLTSETRQQMTLEEIENLLASVEVDQKVMNQTKEWNNYLASSSADIASNSLPTTNVLGNLATLGSLNVGTDLIVTSASQELETRLPASRGEPDGLENSINTLTAPLSIQSLAAQPLFIMGERIQIATNGDVMIKGNVTIEGKLATSEIAPLPQNDLAINLANSVSGDQSGFGPSASSGFGQLLVKGIDGQTVASIDASGSARFSEVTADKLVIAASVTQQTDTLNTSEIQSNSTAGTAILPTNATQIVIKSPFVGENSLVYVTPLSSTLNNVLYAKSKGVGEFIVGFDNPVPLDVKFNWWVIELR